MTDRGNRLSSPLQLPVHRTKVAVPIYCQNHNIGTSGKATKSPSTTSSTIHVSMGFMSKPCGRRFCIRPTHVRTQHASYTHAQVLLSIGPPYQGHSQIEVTGKMGNQCVPLMLKGRCFAVTEVGLCPLSHFFSDSRSQHYAYIYVFTFHKLPNIIHIYMHVTFHPSHHYADIYAHMTYCQKWPTSTW